MRPLLVTSRLSRVVLVSLRTSLFSRMFLLKFLENFISKWNYVERA